MGDPVLAASFDQLVTLHHYGRHWSWRCGLTAAAQEEHTIDRSCRYDHPVAGGEAAAVAAAVDHLARVHSIRATTAATPRPLCTACGMPTPLTLVALADPDPLIYLLRQYDRLLQIHEQVQMDTDEDKALHARAVATAARAVEPLRALIPATVPVEETDRG